MRIWGRGHARRFSLTMALGLLMSLTVLGQVSQQPTPRTSPRKDPFGDEDRPNDPMTQQLHEQQLKALNAQRQMQLVADTDKLLQLATELKTEVGKTDKETLSVTVIRKTEQIEKLAKSVREKMKAIQ
jgi:type VI protein secretion system component VasF